MGRSRRRHRGRVARIETDDPDDARGLAAGTATPSVRHRVRPCSRAPRTDHRHTRSVPHLLVQFHPEATAEIVESWLAFDDADFREAGIDPQDTLGAMRATRDRAGARADHLVGRFLDGRPEAD